MALQDKYKFEKFSILCTLTWKRYKTFNSDITGSSGLAGNFVHFQLQRRKPVLTIPERNIICWKFLCAVICWYSVFCSFNAKVMRSQKVLVCGFFLQKFSFDWTKTRFLLRGLGIHLKNIWGLKLNIQSFMQTFF